MQISVNVKSYFIKWKRKMSMRCKADGLNMYKFKFISTMFTPVDGTTSYKRPDTTNRY